jgi:hypothetical protein
VRNAAWLIYLLACTSLMAAPSTNGLENATVLVIRHAEKPASGRELSAAGLERAKAYVAYFEKLQLEGKAATPDCIVAGADSEASTRPRQTVEPLAQALHLKIHDKHKTKDVQALADYLREKPRGKTILVSWRHAEIPGLLAALGANPAALLPGGKWPDANFCWLVALRYDATGALVSSRRLNEHVCPGDGAFPP